MKGPLGVFVLLLFAPCLAYAQADQMQKPGPEIQKLGYYVGTWKGEGETKGGPFGKAGKLSSNMTCNWFAGGFHLVCQGDETGPSGTRAFYAITSYDEASKAYTEYSISSFGDTEYERHGTLVGDSLTYLGDVGASTKFRYTEAHVSPVLYTYRAEVTQGGKPWTTIAEGKITKVK